MTIDTDLMLAAALVLATFTPLAAIDGLYIHLWKLRLHQRPEARREHALHTARAVLFAPLALLLFAIPSAGPLLWAGVAVAVADTAVELWDVFVESDSRRALGGLSRGEYVLHVVLTILRSSAIVLSLAARPAEAWAWDAPAVLAGTSELASAIGTNLVPGAVILAALHVWLGVRGARVVGTGAQA